MEDEDGECVAVRAHVQSDAQQLRVVSMTAHNKGVPVIFWYLNCTVHHLQTCAIAHRIHDEVNAVVVNVGQGKVGDQNTISANLLVAVSLHDED